MSLNSEGVEDIALGVLNADDKRVIVCCRGIVVVFTFKITPNPILSILSRSIPHPKLYPSAIPIIQVTINRAVTRRAKRIHSIGFVRCRVFPHQWQRVEKVKISRSTRSPNPSSASHFSRKCTALLIRLESSVHPRGSIPLSRGRPLFQSSQTLQGHRAVQRDH